MSRATALLSELDWELDATRRVLERVPFEQPKWKPHQRSMPIAQLAGHIADDPM